MKKYIILYLAFVLAGCDSYFDLPEQSTKPESEIFNNPVMAEGAIMGIYEQFGADRSYRNRLGLYMAVNTDIEIHADPDKGKGANDRKAIAVYDLQSSNTEMNGLQGSDPFSRMYTAIERANICISGIRKYGSPSAGNEMGYLLGEALTLRALLYGDLIRWWGDVPARFEPVTSASIYKPRTDRDSIYKIIIADLAEAVELVPWPGESDKTKTVERVNKAFVKGLRARLCLSAGGYSQRKDGIRLSTDPDLERSKMYLLAKQECADIIENKSCKLATSFVQIFKDNCQDIITSGRESIFEIPYSNSRGQMVSYLGLRHEVSSTTEDKYATTNIKGEVGPVPTLYYDYDSTDIRRDVTVAPYKWVAGKQKLSSISTWYFGKYRAEWMNRQVTANDDGVNHMLMRYSDILLMYAEAENEINGPTVEAKKYLKEVRYRAFPQSLHAQKVDSYIDPITEKSVLFSTIVKERAFEFAGEQLRKQDLIRWNLLKVKMDEMKENVKKLRDGAIPYDNFPIYIYWKSIAGGEIAIYGLNRGEVPKDDLGNVLPESEWPAWKVDNGWNDYVDSNNDAKKWINGTTSSGDLSDIWINTFYANNPDTRQIFPIMDCIITSSNGMLNNSDLNY